MVKVVAVLMIAICSLIVFGSCGRAGLATTTTPQSPPPSATSPAIDLDNCFPAGLAVVKAASFQPSISENQAISTVRDIVRQYFYAQPEDLPTTATLATFTGECQDGRGAVENLPVWVVVVHGLPDMYQGPDQNHQPSSCQVNAAIDASTGALIYGVISGKA